MRNVLSMPFTFNVIVKCWKNAELELRGVIKKKYHDLDEECITTLLYGEFAFALREASQKKEIEKAFRDDLRKTFPHCQFSLDPEKISANLIADVSLHKHAVEKITGGDFGLTLTRPQLSWHKRSGLCRIKHEYQRSLLCQAKLKRRTGKWGKLTCRQKDVFPSRMNYLVLLLYSYSDPERHCLNPFNWQICQSMPADNVENWLKRDEFPSVVHSAEVMKRLSNAQIGTDDQKIIMDIIRPQSRPSLHIRIFWPPGKEPPSCFQVQAVRQGTQQLQQLQQRG